MKEAILTSTAKAQPQRMLDPYPFCVCVWNVGLITCSYWLIYMVVAVQVARADYIEIYKQKDFKFNSEINGQPMRPQNWGDMVTFSTI